MTRPIPFLLDTPVSIRLVSILVVLIVIFVLPLILFLRIFVIQVKPNDLDVVQALRIEKRQQVSDLLLRHVDDDHTSHPFLGILTALPDKPILFRFAWVHL
jgi:hypothetical protein